MATKASALLRYETIHMDAWRAVSFHDQTPEAALRRANRLNASERQAGDRRTPWHVWDCEREVLL